MRDERKIIKLKAEISKFKVFLFHSFVKSPHFVTPAKAGVQSRLSVFDFLESGAGPGPRIKSGAGSDPGFARNDKKRPFSTFYKFVIFGLILYWSLLASPFVFAQKAEGSGIIVPVFSYKVVHVFPHDPKAFTQGLVFHQGFLYEGTGLSGKSSLRKVELETGRIVKRYRLPDQLFGEGITLWQNNIIQLTWKSRIGFVYDRGTFRMLKKFTYPTEGWGITQGRKHLIMSDGTSFLYFLDPYNFKVVKRIQVHDRGLFITQLNELEYIQGEIYANIYQTDRIARISPETGRVTGWIDLQGLLPEKDRTQGADVLNGIAYDAQGDRIFVTGKYWPKLFEIRMVPQ